MSRNFHDSLLYDSATGKTRQVRLPGFCQTPPRKIRVDTTGNCRGQSPLSVTCLIFTLRWNRAGAGQARDPQERKYQFQANAIQERRRLASKGYRQAEISECRENGEHTIWD